MKKLIIIPFLLVSILGFNQNVNFQYGYNAIFDTVYLIDSDTLNQVNISPPTRDFDWLYAVNYGDIDSTEVLLYIQGSIAGYGWETFTDTVTLDSNSTERVFYLKGDTPDYPDLKFIFERDKVDTTLDGWIRTGWYTRKTD